MCYLLQYTYTITKYMYYYVCDGGEQCFRKDCQRMEDFIVTKLNIPSFHSIVYIRNRFVCI